jgi:hypothetical protein
VSRKRKSSSVQYKNLENTAARSAAGGSRPEKKDTKTEFRDDIHSSPHMFSVSKISQREKNSIEAFLHSVIPNAGLIGVIKVPDKNKNTLLPVAFVEGSTEPLIFRSLNVNRRVEPRIREAINYQKNIYDLEVNAISFVKDRCIFKRTYIPLTLEDVLASDLPVKAELVFATLTRLFYLSAEMYKNSLVHGHIHPGNIVYGGMHDGCLIDYGVSLLERPNRALDESFPHEFMGVMPSHLFDSYGLGYTLNRVLKEVHLHSGRNVPPIDALQSSFSPLISALMNRDPERRPDAHLARLMFLDILPMIYPDFTAPETPEFRLREQKFSEDETDEKIPEMLTAEFDSPEFENSFQDAYESADDHPVDEYKANSRPDIHSKDSLGPAKNTDSRFVVNILFVLLLVVLAFLLYKAKDNFIAVYEGLTRFSDEHTYEIGDTFTGPYLGYDKLRAAWGSQVPSRMKLVARQAVHISEHRELAEQVILTSLRQDEISSSLVDTKLLRVAFHDQWEDQLDETDRRYALSLGLIGILKDVLPPGLGNIEERHPTILLSILSSGNEKVYSVLNKTPAEKLSQLPPPYGTAFQILTSGMEDISCSDPGVISVARFSTRGIESAKEVQKFLSEDFKRRTSAVAVALSLNRDSSRQLLDTVLYHPNFAVSNEYTDWAKKIQLEKWQSIDPIDQLFLLAGVPIKNSSHLETAEIADLFMHPEAEIRKFAIQLSLDKIEFRHPAAMDILQSIQDEPELFTPEQLVSLLAILVDPGKASTEKKELLMSFLHSDPDISICKKMLLATAGGNSGTDSLDSYLAMYLVKANWDPNPSELLILSEHRDKVARMYAYKKLFELEDTKHAILLLKGALEKEKLPEYREQLKELIQALS